MDSSEIEGDRSQHASRALEHRGWGRTRCDLPAVSHQRLPAVLGAARLPLASCRQLHHKSELADRLERDRTRSLGHHRAGLRPLSGNSRHSTRPAAFVRSAVDVIAKDIGLPPKAESQEKSSDA